MCAHVGGIEPRVPDTEVVEVQYRDPAGFTNEELRLIQVAVNDHVAD